MKSFDVAQVSALTVTDITIEYIVLYIYIYFYYLVVILNSSKNVYKFNRFLVHKKSLQVSI